MSGLLCLLNFGLQQCTICMDVLRLSLTCAALCMQATKVVNVAVSWGKGLLKTLSDQDKAYKAVVEEIGLQLMLQGKYPKTPSSQVSRLW